MYADTMWTTEGARRLIEPIRDHIWSLGYHIALGGGTFWRGFSSKDLDLFLLPLFSVHQRERATPEDVILYLQSKWGVSESFSSSMGEDADDRAYLGWTVGMFTVDTKRIDVFVHPVVRDSL